ncbi:MAG TPA: hypothetical protein VGF63_08590 [Solirubrobacteraceae bacterium]|jgi:hypothetical protein
MTPVEILLIAIALVVLALGAGGYAATGRRTRSRDGQLREQLAKAELELAHAHAADKGWERATLEAAARAAAEQRFGATQIDSLTLLRVIDKPGTDADQAVFRIETPEGEHTVTLGRTGGVWGAA